jgi:hypothetical protein
MKKEEVEILKQILQRFIDDVERGKPIEEAGWVKKEHNTECILKRLGLYEESIQNIRISLHNPLPKNLLKTEEGDIFSNIQLAMKIRKLIPKLTREQSLQIGTEISGFIYMLNVSEFPVFSQRLFRNGFSSFDEWYINVSNVTHLLALLAARKVWGIKNVKKALEPLRHFSLSTVEMEEQDKKVGVERVKRVLKWDKVLEIINQNTCKVMGFLWYVEYLILSEGIHYPESMMLVQERAWKMLEEKMRKSIWELRKEVIENVNQIERETLDRDPSGKPFAIASWHEILRLPW